MSARTHGASFSPTYRTWKMMKQRCTNPKDPAWARYGGRGIRVCERWVHFEAFLADMGPRPSIAHSIDRIDNGGHYEPGNCRWATTREQSLNKRSTRYVQMNGQMVCLTEAARALGMHVNTLRFHVLRKGRTIEDVQKRMADRG